MHFLCYTNPEDKSAEELVSESGQIAAIALRRWLPLLQSLGGVEHVNCLEEGLLSVYEKYQSDDGVCFVLAFASPPTLPLSLPFPVIPVFSWCHQSLPHKGALDDAQKCWVSALEYHRNALSHSRFAEGVVAADVGELLSIVSIPIPVLPHRNKPHSPLKNLEIPLPAGVLDSRDFWIDADTLYPADGVIRPLTLETSSEPVANKITLDLGKADSDDALAVGFYAPEGWGAWTRADNAWILLPQDISGRVNLRIFLQAYGKNTGNKVFLHVGENIVPLFLTSDMTPYEFELHIDSPVNYLRFSNLDHSLRASAEDTRTLGVGVGHVSLACLDAAMMPAAPSQRRLKLEGVVYTAFLDPLDARQNWIDVLTAFCFAFREDATATLILLVNEGVMRGYIDDLFELLCQLHPFHCRVVTVHGELNASELAAVYGATTFVVSAARAAGVPLALMDAMAAGVPAIAPRHTAFADFITQDNACIVASSPEPTYWPADNEQVLNTYWCRPDWESLYEAYTESFHIASQDPERYARMSGNAMSTMNEYASQEVVLEKLKVFFDELTEGRRAP